MADSYKVTERTGGPVFSVCKHMTLHLDGTVDVEMYCSACGSPRVSEAASRCPACGASRQRRADGSMAFGRSTLTDVRSEINRQMTGRDRF